jgi:DNA polymerase III subunit gamma/tau
MWDTKYRPKTFDDVLGQNAAVEILKSRLRAGNALETSYIFSGGHGQGKTTLARILARALLCENLTPEQEPCNECDSCQAILTESSLAFYERDAASNGSVAVIRELVDELSYVVQGAAKQIHLFDEAHRMSKEAQDVLLKPIEEKRMVGIFCTTEPEKIRGTIRSRCEEHRIRKITREHISERLKRILQAEKVEYEEDALFTIIDCSGGHVRDILNRMEMIAQKRGVISLEVTREYLGLGLVTIYYDILLGLDNPATILHLIDEACERVGSEELAVGLAEAAMNSYRLAHKMFAEFAYVDRVKAEELYKKYGNNVLLYARKFASSYEARTKVGLITDVVSLTTSLELPKTSVQIPVAQSSPSQLKSPDSAPVKPTPNQVATPQIPQTPGKIGNVGQDPLALTTLDVHGVKKDFPRGHEVEERRVVPASERNKPLTPNDWKRSFDQHWRS